MKLRNKKTSEIGWLETYYGETDEKMIAVLDKKSEYHPYNSLAELNEEWEDYEEPKEYWYINTTLNRVENNYKDSDDLEYDKSIGNHFETREEAEKAVEKLKAWTRLENKGFRFVNNSLDICCHTINFKIDNQYDMTDETSKDLFLLFGGEE